MCLEGHIRNLQGLQWLANDGYEPMMTNAVRPLGVFIVLGLIRIAQGRLQRRVSA